MPRGKQTKGQCALCGAEIAKGWVARHLSTCPAWKNLLEKSEKKKGIPQTLYHLRIQSADVPLFWLDVEMRGNATLEQLDKYLRVIWLECCGHLSEFCYKGQMHEEISKKERIQEIFEPGIELTHIYDFGTSSTTLIKATGIREGQPVTSNPITLLVRNVMPESTCIDCGMPATLLCTDCLYEDEVWGTLCEKCAKTHPHTENSEPIELVNSPRLGMCGYTGPANPPY